MQREFESVGDAGPLDADAAQQRIDDWTRRLGALREFTADASSYLPSYDAEQAGQLTAKLEEDFGVAKGLVQPRRRFAFRRKPADAAPPSSSSSSAAAAPPPSAAPSSTAAAAGDAGAAVESALDRLERDIAAGERRVERRSGEVVVVEADASGGRGGGGVDLRLLDLQDCVVLVYVRWRAARTGG